MQPLFIHYFLRKTNCRNTLVANTHIILTLAIIFLLPYVYYHTPLIVENIKNDFLPTPQYERWKFNIRTAYFLWGFLIALQIIFVAFVTVQLFFPKSNKKLP